MCLSGDRSVKIDDPKYKTLQQIRSEAENLEQILTTSLDSPVLRDDSPATPQQKLAAVRNGISGLRNVNAKLTSLVNRLIAVTEPQKIFDNVPWMIAIGSVGVSVLLWMTFEMWKLSLRP